MEDSVLLRSLGVDSANPEDIEREIFNEAGNAVGIEKDTENISELIRDDESTADPSSVAYLKLHNKLRAVEVEIDAVASSFEPSKEGRGDDINDGNDNINDVNDRPSLQQALTADRLRSLERTRAQLKRELDSFGNKAPIKRSGQGESLGWLVKDEPKKKIKTKESQTSSSFPTKRLKKISYDEDADFDAVLDAASGGFVETEREELIRKGMLTPFHRLQGFERRIQEPGQSSNQRYSSEEDTENIASSSILRAAQSISEIARTRPTSKLLEAEQLPKLDAPTRPFQRLKTPLSRTDSSKAHKKTPRKQRRPLPEKKWRKLAESDGPGSLDHEEQDEGEVVEDAREDEQPCVVLEGGLKIPDAIFSKLFDYQKVGVQWLWELHCQRAGGIIGDEMGLGKTIQVISFLAALHFSGLYKPSIIICPVTLLRQWQRETHKWYPKFQVHILHDSANSSTKHREEEEEEEEEDYDDGEEDEELIPKSKRKWDELILKVIRSQSGLLLTTYEQLRILGEKLLDVEWGYAVLDEGHRIRNPNAEITLACKQLQTVHRIIMTGAPIQNKLAELWSLFDFVFPGKLGVLPVFEAEFAVPITVGGYANATPLQVSTAYRCAIVLRDLILPYLLRRVKADVHAQLPNKTEQVLFCSLTTEQRDLYRAFLASAEVEQIFDGSRNSLYGIDVMRKICNHPDLLEREHSANHADYGNPDRSGKMKVIDRVLQLWKEQHHRVLLFAQTQQMLDILEGFLKSKGYEYRRMDGLTPVKQRMALIDEFNLSTEVFVFLLTTKVGGLGTNLTGANRVLIYDPDWNPSTDMQARERAWRIGQTKDVTVYRLITRGTIEEKVYHRQIYKHFLTNKILKNPQQKRFFRSRDLKDLFTLKEEEDGHGGATETAAIFNDLPAEAGETTEAMKTEDEQTNVLKSLFDASGIHSAMDHEAIVNANEGERTRFEQQAVQVAQRAADALRRSRQMRSRDGVAVPTWTGRSGAAGAPPAVRQRFGGGSTRPQDSDGAANVPAAGLNGKALSSATLLARMRGKEEAAEQEGSRRRRQISGGLPAELLVRRICSFLQQHGGVASSDEIVAAFRDRVPAAELPLFKNLLKEIAVLEKAPGGSSWVLKPDYC